MTGTIKPDRYAWMLALVAAAGAVAGALVTGAFGYFEHSSDLDAKTIELTISILRSKPDPQTMPLRDWAIDTPQKRAHFQFTAEQVATLKNEKLPYESGPTRLFTLGGVTVAPH